ERLVNQPDSLSSPSPKAGLGLVRRVADDHDRQRLAMPGAAYRVEQRFAHLEYRAVENERIGVMFGDQLDDARIVAACHDIEAAFAESEREQLGDLRRVICEQYAGLSTS